MNVWKTPALAGALVTAAGMGAALAPVAHGHGATVAAVAPQVQIFTGGGRLGVSVREVSDEDAKRGRLGVVVEEVRDDSPAAKAGFRVGDIVSEFDGERVRSVRQFTRLVQESASGRSVNVTVTRDGQKTPLSVEPRESNSAFRTFEMLRDHDDFVRFEQPEPFMRPARPPRPPSSPTPPAAPRAPLLRDFELFRRGTTLGIGISDLSPQLAEYFGTKDGVLVTSVNDSSAAAKAGVKAGDVITAVNGNTVNSASDARREIQRLESAADFTLTVTRDKRTVTLKGKIEERETRRNRVII